MEYEVTIKEKHPHPSGMVQSATILSQTLSEIDLPAIVRALNPEKPKEEENKQ